MIRVLDVTLGAAGIWYAHRPTETPEVDTNHPSYMHSERQAAVCSSMFKWRWILATSETSASLDALVFYRCYGIFFINYAFSVAE